MTDAQEPALAVRAAWLYYVHGLTQAQVAEGYRGRAITAYLMALLAGMPLGAFVGGLLGDQIGLRSALGGFAGVIIVYVIYAQLRRTGLAAIDANEVAEPDRA